MFVFTCSSLFHPWGKWKCVNDMQRVPEYWFSGQDADNSDSIEAFSHSSEKLQEKKQEETDAKFFTEMPCKHYMEVTTVLLKK